MRHAPRMEDDAPDPYDALGELYDEWVISVTEDVPFYRELARQAGQPARVLELGAGSGRISQVLARDGHEVTGIDIAAGQLARLEAAAPGARTIVLDMRSLPGPLAGERFDLVIAPFRAMLHVADDADAVLSACATLLRPGGRIAFDVFHPLPDDAMFAGDWQLRRRLEPGPGGMPWAIWERASISPDGRSVRLEVRCTPQVASEAIARERNATMVLGTPPPNAWRDAIERAGLELESVFGWFDERPLQGDDVDSVWVACTAG